METRDTADLEVCATALCRLSRRPGSKCIVKLDGQTAVKTYGTGDTFEVPAKSGFDISVKSGICEYICSFLLP